MIRLLLLSIALALPLPDHARASIDAPALTEAQVEHAFQVAYAARRNGRPDEAEKILAILIAARPNAPQLRFDLAVAQAEQGRCVQAARSFEIGKSLDGTPHFARMVDIAMQDLCPRLSRIEASLGLALLYDTNTNAGSAEENITVGGIPVDLSGDAVARNAFGYRLSGGLAYNIPLTHAFYAVPSLSFSLSDYEGKIDDSLNIAPALMLRYRGDRMDWRLGPTAILNYDANGLSARGSGVAGQFSYVLTPRSGITGAASWIDVEDEANPLQDYRQTGLALEYTRKIGNEGTRLRTVLRYTDLDYRDDLQDLNSLTLEIGLSGALTREIGYDISLAQTHSEGGEVHPFFGVKRRDDITTVSANLSFARFESWFGRPYIGVSHSLSRSSFPTKDYDRTRANFGFSRRF